MKRPWFTYLPPPIGFPLFLLSAVAKGQYAKFQYHRAISRKQHNDQVGESLVFFKGFSDFVDHLSPSALVKLRLNDEQGRYLKGLAKMGGGTGSALGYEFDPEPAYVSHFYAVPSPQLDLTPEELFAALQGDRKQRARLDDAFRRHEADGPLATCGEFGWYPQLGYPERVNLHPPNINFILLPERPESDTHLEALLRGQYSGFERRQALGNGDRLVFTNTYEDGRHAHETTLRFNFLDAYESGEPVQTFHVYGANLRQDFRFSSQEHARFTGLDLAHHRPGF